MALYVQYGCGLCAPEDWVNYDASPTLRLQRIPLLGGFIAGMLPPRFPSNVRYGDIVKGLPLQAGSVDALYCSHVLEHLSLADFRTALRNSNTILKPGGVFRLVMPDLQGLVQGYAEAAAKSDPEAAIRFMKFTGMALEERPRGLKATLASLLGNARHQWLWDRASTKSELEKAGFSQLRDCTFGDAADPRFQSVEAEDRFAGAIAIEAIKR